MNLDPATQGACDSGDCFYVNTVSWRNETTPNPTESHPRMVFERLFGDGGSAAQRLARITQDRQHPRFGSRRKCSRSPTTLGPGDSSKLGEYLDSVREIEQRIQNAEAQGAHRVELPDRPIDIPDSFEEHTKLMFDLQVLAYPAPTSRASSA